MSRSILLCTDLDRTVLPNGPHPESPQARPLLRRLTARPEIALAYVSGRHKALLQEAIAEYDLPQPDYAICDVGTSIYAVADAWQPWQAWQDEIAPDWQGMDHDHVAALLADMVPLTPQEPAKQNRFKISFYLPQTTEPKALLNEVRRRLEYRGIRAGLVWSIDDIKHVGLLDILPASANKLHAIRFLMDRKHFDNKRTVFAGDSGNDLAVLASGIPSVLVANASDAVRAEAVRLSEAEHLYLARGGFMGMNGNYAAGVLEGLAHFLPETVDWLRSSEDR